jgi:hypothetical protein
MLEERKPTEWSHEQRVRPVTRDELRYELESLQRTVDTGFETVDRKFRLLGQRQARGTVPRTRMGR